jgi:hypothetical protein
MNLQLPVSRILFGALLLLAASAAPAQNAPPAKPAAAAKSAPVAKAVPPPPAAAPQRVAPSERELYVRVTVDATQDWKKNDPKYPGEQYSKGTSKQTYEIRTRLRSDGRLEVRNMLDPDVNLRMEAKTVFLARQAKKNYEASGKKFRVPSTPQEKQALSNDFMRQNTACNADPTCLYELQLKYAALFAAIENPWMLEEDTEPGRYLYYLPYTGCPESSHVTIETAIDGVRYNKDVDKFIPFKERRRADTRNGTDGLAMCRHLLAMIDTQDPQKPMFQENIWIPTPTGITEYTENDHTSRTEQPQPMMTAVLDWVNETLRHAPTRGTATVSLPLPLALNGNQTVLGLFTGTAKVQMTWSFEPVGSAASTTPAKP